MRRNNYKLEGEPEGSPAVEWRMRTLQQRPGFLIRRLHQIHVALFAEECGGEGVTPVQYSVMTALDQLGAVEQIALGRAVGLDRANVAEVILRLEQREWVERSISVKDRRMKIATLTEKGRALLDRVEALAARAHERTIEALAPAERKTLLKYLRLLVAANNDISRSPMGLD